MDFMILSKEITSVLLLLLLSTIECNNNDNESNGRDEGIAKYNSAVKEPISTSEDLLTLHKGKDVLQKLVRLLIDAEFREDRNLALKTVSPKSDAILPRILDDDLLDGPKVHIHHLFPPRLIKPLQKVIVQQLINYIRRDPIKQFKRKVRRIAGISTVAVGVGLGVKELKEIKSHPPIAHYRVTGVEDLSGHKYSKSYKKHENYEIEDRSDDDFDDDPEYKSVKDFKLMSDKNYMSKKSKHYWPFHESKEEIYEKWNKFPAPTDIDPFHHKVKYLHKSFHELHPELLHIVKDVHGLIGKKVSKVSRLSPVPGLEDPIVLAGQLVKLVDSLIPSIRIRIPFIDYLKHSFIEKSKPKVVYVKQPPKVKYVGIPVPEDSLHIPDSMPEPEPHLAEPNVYRRQISLNHNSDNSKKYLYDRPSAQPNFFTAKHGYDSEPPSHKYTHFFDETLRVYHDKKGAGA